MSNATPSAEAVTRVAGETPDIQRFTALFHNLALDRRTLSNPPRASITPPPLDHKTRDEMHVAALPLLTISDTDGRPPELAITETLGEGGMGIVRRARQLSLGRDVAVKSIKADQISPDATAKLLREALITGSLEHPNIIPVHALGRDQDGPLMSMKLVEGVPWSEALADTADGIEHRIVRASGRDPLAFHLAVFERVCRAIEYAHSRDIIHRDLKPDNVMIGRFGEVYLLDWGIAVSLVDDGTGALPLVSDQGGMAGSPAYMAPEMVQPGAIDLSTQTDVYLLGGLLHEVLVGTPRHHGAFEEEGGSIFTVLFAAWQSERFEYGDDVPVGLATICNKAMAREPCDRHESAEQLRIDVMDFVEHRASSLLCAAAEVELASLLEECRRCNGVDDEVIRSVHALHASVVNGFRQARAIWPDNPAVSDGLHSANVALAQCVLNMGDAKSAALLIAELERPEPELQHNLEKLRGADADKEAEVARLRAMERSMDLSIGSRTRSMAALFMGLLWTGLPALAAWRRAHGDYEPSYDDQFVTTVLLAAFVGLLTWYWRDELMHSRVNRYINRALWIAVFASAGGRIVGAALEIPPDQVLIMLMISFSTIVGMLAATVDWRLVYSAVAYLVAALLASGWPEWTFELVAVGNLIVYGIIAWVWRPARTAG